jgi:hypothetical protein
MPMVLIELEKPKAKPQSHGDSEVSTKFVIFLCDSVTSVVHDLAFWGNRYSGKAIRDDDHCKSR